MRLLFCETNEASILKCMRMTTTQLRLLIIYIRQCVQRCVIIRRNYVPNGIPPRINEWFLILSWIMLLEN